MNFISDVVCQNHHTNLNVYTSKNSSPFKNISFEKIKIRRYGIISVNPFVRYFSYVYYNFFCTLHLIISRPDIVLVYETLSICPAFIYKLLFPSKRIHIHYHEYISPLEKKRSSYYMKMLFKCEEKLLVNATCSHTNVDRKTLFLRDNKYLKEDQVKVYPNLPPTHWWENYGKNKKNRITSPIKLVYVGSLDNDTMFLTELLDWVNNNKHKLHLTLISQQYNEKTLQLINDSLSPNIILKEAIDYYDLPNELINYDVGLVIYKGHIPNYIYTVPNKVYEYLSIGLTVLADKCLNTTASLNLGPIKIIDYRKLSQINLSDLFSSKFLLSSDIYTNESLYRDLFHNQSCQIS